LRARVLHRRTDIVPRVWRQEVVAELHADFERRSRLRAAVKCGTDRERLKSRSVLAAANARDLLALKDSLKALPEINQHLAACTSPFLKQRHEQWHDLAELAVAIERTLQPDVPASVKEGGLIRDGYDPALDDLRVISRDGKAWIAGIERQEREKTGIRALKIRYNQVFGYYIEITKTNLERVSLHSARRQA